MFYIVIIIINIDRHSGLAKERAANITTNYLDWRPFSPPQSYNNDYDHDDYLIVMISRPSPYIDGEHVVILWWSMMSWLWAWCMCVKHSHYISIENCLGRTGGSTTHRWYIISPQLPAAVCVVITRLNHAHRHSLAQTTPQNQSTIHTPSTHRPTTFVQMMIQPTNIQACGCFGTIHVY